MAAGGGRRARLGASVTVLRDHELGKLMLSWGLGIAAEWAVLVTASVVAFEQAGAVGVGLVGVVRVLPGAVGGPLVSIVADRQPRPRVLATVHATWGVLCLVLAGLAALSSSLVPMLVLLGLSSVVTSVFKPCVNALVPQLVHSPRELVAANSAYSLVEGAGTAAGPLLAGLLLAVGGPDVSFAGIGLVLGVAAVASTMIRTGFQPPRRVRRAPEQRTAGRLRGFSALVRTPGVRPLFWVFMSQLVMRGLLNVFVVTLALGGVTGDDGAAGVLFAAIGVGGLVGALATLGLGGVGSRGARWFAVGALLWGLPVLVIGLAPAVAVGALVVLGLGNALLDVTGFSLLNRLLPDHVAGRAFGAFWGCAAGAVALGSALAPELIALLGLPSAMMVTGGALAAGVVVMWPALRHVDAQVSADPGDVDVLGRVPILAPMPVIGIESLARTARQQTAEPGEVVVRQGERGELFYVVAEGRLQVTEDEQARRVLGAGDGFGEIALLATDTRTATVTALTRCRLLCIDRESFVTAVTGHRTAEQVASDTITQLWSAGGRPRRRLP